MSSSGAICAICYEDARPLREDLQSISACGHVFHELCLQQWIEYCPSGRNPTCPLCKQSCTPHDVHRLYFQSAGSESSQPQVSLPENPQTAGEDQKQVDSAPALRKLESQLTAAKTALQSRNEQLKELDSQIAANLLRAEKAEAASVVANRELSQCRHGLARVQEDLKCCSNERELLQKKNQAMAKDLAAYRLVGDADLGEEDILRLVNLGNGSNKNAIIETLTKSLVLRNKSYKELMTRCNSLGAGECRAVRKSEKSAEHLRKMKARVQELEKLLEEKDNACLRGLNRDSLKPQGEDVLSSPRLMIQASAQGISEPRTPPSDQFASASTLSRGRNIDSTEDILQENTIKLSGFGQDLDGMPRAELSSIQLPNIVKERGLVGAERVQPACPKNLNASEEKFSSRKRGHCDGGVGLNFREDCSTSISSSYWVIKSRHLLREIGLLNNSILPLDREKASTKYPMTAAGSVPLMSFPRPELTVRRNENESSAIAPAFTHRDKAILKSPRAEHVLEVQSCSENPGLARSSVGLPVSRYGSFAKRPFSDGQPPAPSSYQELMVGVGK